MTDRFDVVVLGAGPGGYVAAIRAAQLGKRVAVVEEKYWGGVCLNVGCIPTKALLRNAELAHIFTHEAKTFGIKVDGQVSFDYGEAFRRSRRVADGRVKGVHYLMKKNGITEFDGRGSFVDANTLQVALSDGTTSTIAFDHCIIATGATPRLLPGTSRSDRVVTYEELILTEDVPQSVVIAGAGAIGIEFAYVLHNYGVKVTIVEFLDQDRAAGGQGRLGGAGQAVPQARHRRADVDPGRLHRRVGPAAARHGHHQGRFAAGPEADKVLQAIGFARTPPGTDWRTPGSGSPSAAPWTSTPAAARPCPTSTPSVTSRRS